ncbi:MAG: T9SS type A sorting domain-containing protein [Saprospiraceae bacterium]
MSAPCANERTEFIIQPNPTRSNFQIVTSTRTQPFAVKVFDVNGKLIQQWDRKRSGETLDLVTVPTGLYVVRMYQKDGSFSAQRLIVN